MSFATRIAKMRLSCHASLVDFGNGLNQLHVLSDEKAEKFCAKHTILALEAGARMHGKSLNEILK